MKLAEKMDHSMLTRIGEVDQEMQMSQVPSTDIKKTLFITILANCPTGNKLLL